MKKKLYILSLYWTIQGLNKIQFESKILFVNVEFFRSAKCTIHTLYVRPKHKEIVSKTYRPSFYWTSQGFLFKKEED